ncbi:unnamed protein product [Diamesa hyperborea]
MSHPVVIVLSNDSTTPALDVIANIRNISNEENKKLIGENDLIGYLHEISTKYYKTEILLLPVDNLLNIPDTVTEKLEGVLIYFDSANRSFLGMLPNHVEFIKANETEFCVMLCKELPENKEDGITFKEIKDCYNMLDIIELERKSEDEDEDVYNPTGYEELAQALKSVIWSNVNVNNVSPHTNENSNGLLSNEEDQDSGSDIENELENFEKLLSQVMQFRPNTNNLSRDDRLSYAQGFAEVFEKLIMQDEDISEPTDDDKDVK